MGNFSARLYTMWVAKMQVNYFSDTIYFPIKENLCLESKYRTYAQLFIL